MNSRASNSGDVRHSDLFKAFLGELFLWTAVWTGFPLALSPEDNQASQPPNSGVRRDPTTRRLTTRDDRSLPAAMSS